MEGIECLFINTLSESVIKDIKSNTNIKLIVPKSFDATILEGDELLEFEDYLFEQYINKKIVVIYGNCHTGVIAKYLANDNNFNSKYYLYPTKMIHTIKDITYFNNPVFQYCDVFIHQSIRNNNRYGEQYSSQAIIKRINKTCRVISIPNVYGLPTCFFPQYTKEEEFKHRGGASVFFRDRIIDELSEKGESAFSICKIYKNYKFDEEVLDLELKKFFNKLKERETEWDIKCYEFIKSNYQEKKLFYDPNHPTNYFLKYVAEEILVNLQVEPVFHKEKIDVIELNGYEMPMLESVKRHYGMKFTETEEIRINSLNKVKLGKMRGLNSYIMQYTSCQWQNKSIGKIQSCFSRLLFISFKIYNLLYRCVCRKEILKISSMEIA